MSTQTIGASELAQGDVVISGVWLAPAEGQFGDIPQDRPYTVRTAYPVGDVIEAEYVEMPGTRYTYARNHTMVRRITRPAGLTFTRKGQYGS